MSKGTERCPHIEVHIMKALIVYASWFGHNRTIARALAEELARRHTTVVCAPVSHVTTSEIIGYDMLVFGTYTHAHHASGTIRRLCDSIPLRRLARMAIGVFGTGRPGDLPGGVDDLAACIESRGCTLAVPPMRLALSAPDFLPWSRLAPDVRESVAAFAAELVDAAIPASIAA
jgi:flavorubredoxin